MSRKRPTRCSECGTTENVKKSGYCGVCARNHSHHAKFIAVRRIWERMAGGAKAYKALDAVSQARLRKAAHAEYDAGLRVELPAAPRSRNRVIVREVIPDAQIQAELAAPREATRTKETTYKNNLSGKVYADVFPLSFDGWVCVGATDAMGNRLTGYNTGTPYRDAENVFQVGVAHVKAEENNFLAAAEAADWMVDHEWVYVGTALAEFLEFMRCHFELKQQEVEVA